MDLRMRIGEMLDRVALRHDEYIIERKGRPMAALVPVEKLDAIRDVARRHAIDFLDRQRSGPGAALSDKEAMSLALDAQRWARARKRNLKAPKPRK
jgi:prevent-host-death family protein